jgi:mono/diheme cytochrome c family protein
MKTNVFGLMAALTLPPFLVSCSKAETLHNLQPPVVAFNAENPTWENGMGALVNERCATCHSPTPSSVAPRGTGALVLDFRNKSEFDSLAKSNRSTILGLGRKGVEVMPPTYADPLSEAEKTALIKYLDSVIPK